MSEHKLFYYSEDVEAKVKEAKIVYFFLGLGLGAVTTFFALIAIGVMNGIQ